MRRISKVSVGADASVRPMSSRKFSQYSVGTDAHIGPLGSYEFAENFCKTGANCRADVGIGPYNRLVPPQNASTAAFSAARALRYQLR